MTKIILSHEDYERVLREGLDLDAYLQGRFDEAASEVKYLNEEDEVTVPINLNGERLGEDLAKSSLPVQLSEGSEIEKFHEDCHKAFMEAAYPAVSVNCESADTRRRVLYAQNAADRAISRTDELATRVAELEHVNRVDSITLPSGKTYTVGDVYKFPQKDDTAVIILVDKEDVDCLPIQVSWKRRGYKEWMSEGELSTAFKIN